MKYFKDNDSILELVKGTNSNLNEIKIRSVDASVEKHVPEVIVNGDLVTVIVGSQIHPMVENHYIEFIEIETKNGSQRKYLKPGDEPKATFKLYNDEFVIAYAYCNLHGMWNSN